MVPLLIKGTKKGETTCNFNFFLVHFQSQNYFYLHYTCVLTPWWDATVFFHFGPLPLGGGGDTSTTLGEGGGISTTSGDIATTSSSLQKQETIS